MAKPKKKLTSAQRAAKKQRKKDFMTVFMNGRQVRVRRPPTMRRHAGGRIHPPKRRPHLAAPAWILRDPA